MILLFETGYSGAQALLESSTDLFCGPRSVSKILDHYGIEYDWNALVAEIQPDATEGASLLDLQRSLETRGIVCHRVVVRFSDLNRYDAGILFIPPEFFSTSTIGHFLFCVRQGDELEIGPVVDEVEGDFLRRRLSGESSFYFLAVGDEENQFWANLLRHEMLFFGLSVAVSVCCFFVFRKVKSC